MNRSSRPQNSATNPQGDRLNVARPDLARLLDVVRPEPLRKRTILRLTLFAVMIACTIFAWLLMEQWQTKRIERALEQLRDTVEQRWSETNLQYLQPIRTLCDEMESGAISEGSQFDARVAAIRKSNDAYEALYWISSDMVPVAGSEIDALPYIPDQNLWSQLRRSGKGKPIVGPSYEGGLGRSLVLFYFPLGDGGQGGGVGAVMRTSRLMEHFADEQLRSHLSISIIRDEQVIYQAGGYLIEPDPTLKMTLQLRILDQMWRCQLMPTSQFMRQYQSQTPEMVLAVGVVGCLISAGSLLDAMKRKWQHMMLERGHLQVIEIISELTRSTSTNRGDWKRALLTLLESAQPVTDSDVIGIYQLAANRQRLELVSSYGNIPVEKTVELTDSATSLLHDALEGRSITFVRQRRDSMAALRLFEQMHLHGGVLCALQVDRVIGVMLFASRSAEAWADGRRSLVKLWASQTAALLGDEAMRDQMRDALSVQEKLSQRREMMLTLLGEIYQAGSMEGTLSHIAQFSPRSLGLDACVVALRTNKENELEIVAGTGELGVRFFGRRLQLTGEQALRLAHPDGVCVVPLEEAEEYGLRQFVEPWLAAMAYVPMAHSDGRPIGCLLLMSATRGAFTSDQLELARVLASRASAAIENAQLNQQIRSDAETRMMLLRELNHRVKNNLAGIVGLLSMSSNMDMPENVRQWLDRVTERIGNIARAHELFSGGITAVSLSQLVEQVIPSLSVVKPPGVVIAKEFGEREIWLKTTQAVSLAMIIHELCYNAIVHGLGARGTLTIRAQQTPAKNVVLDIIDDGAVGAPNVEEDGGVATMAPPATSTGMGLRLVKGLVGRELRGRFLMRRRSEGGTIVTVEFPLDREREGELSR